MPSTAATTARGAFHKARLLRRRQRDPSRPAANSLTDRQIFYHASLAASVAAWDGYLNNVVLEFFNVISDPLQAGFHTLHTLSREHALRQLKRFNTPNFNNSRELLVNCTGFDPYSHWTWDQRGLTVLQVQQKLNEILQVRHSFAHGHGMPSYQWTKNSTGKIGLTRDALQDVENILTNLVTKTDSGLAAYIRSTYAVNILW